MQARVVDLERDHDQLRAEPEFRQALTRLTVISGDFVSTIRGAWLFATREPSWKERVFWVGTDDFIGSAIGIHALVASGLRNQPKRELRFLLESAVKYVYVDEQLARQTPLTTRLAYLNRKVPTSSIDPFDDIDFTQILGDDSTAFRSAVWRLYGKLSEAVHLSATQVKEHVAAIERGSFVGFETAADVEAFNDLLVETYDVLIPFALLALGPSSAADMLDVPAHQSAWMFTGTPFTSAALKHLRV